MKYLTQKAETLQFDRSECYCLTEEKKIFLGLLNLVVVSLSNYRDQVVMTNKEENPTEKGGKYQILARPTEKVED